MNATPLIVKGVLIIDRAQNIKLRVVWIDRHSNTAWLCRIDDNSRPFSMPIDQIYDELDPTHGSFSIANEPPLPHPVTECKRNHHKRKRCGQKYWDMNQRPLLGKADGDVQGPGDCFQIDATLADIYLVSKFYQRRNQG